MTPVPPYSLTDDQPKFVFLGEGFLGTMTSERKKYTGKEKIASI